MDDAVFRFFCAAKELRLSDAERTLARDALFAFFRAYPVRDAGSERHTGSVKQLRSLRAVGLTHAERDEVLGNLYAYMRAHPVQSGVKASVAVKIADFFAFRRFAAVSLCAVLLMAMGGTVAYAAEGSLPDEILYPVKIHVTEPILGALYRRSPERRARFEEMRLERRLEEAERLSRGDRLTEEFRAAFERQLEERVDRFEQRLSELPSDEDREVLRERVSQKLERREEVLRSIEKEVIAPERVRKIRGHMRSVRARLHQPERQEQKGRDLPLPTLIPFREKHEEDGEIKEGDRDVPERANGQPERVERKNGAPEDPEEKSDAKKNARDIEKRRTPPPRGVRDLLPAVPQPQPVSPAGEHSSAASAIPATSTSSASLEILKKPKRERPLPHLPRLHLWQRK